MKAAPIGMLASGGGRTFANLLERCRQGRLPARMAALVCSDPGAGVLERARAAGVPALVVHPREHASPRALGQACFDFLGAHGAEWVLMGGYLHHLLVPPDFAGRVLNIHPSLIPAFCGKGFYGHRVHRAVLARGVRVTGVTVHFVDDLYDHGPIVHQVAVPVALDDTEESLADRVFAAEKEAYPEALRLLLSGELRLVDGRVLPGPGRRP